MSYSQDSTLYMMIILTTFILGLHMWSSLAARKQMEKDILKLTQDVGKLYVIVSNLEGESLD